MDFLKFFFWFWLLNFWLNLLLLFLKILNVFSYNIIELFCVLFSRNFPCKMNGFLWFMTFWCHNWILLQFVSQYLFKYELLSLKSWHLTTWPPIVPPETLNTAIADSFSQKYFILLLLNHALGAGSRQTDWLLCR